MKKIGKNFAVLLGIALLGASSLTACNDNESQNETSNSKFEIWSTYNTAEVYQNVEDSTIKLSYEKLDAGFDVQMMKNETEGAQLIITAKEDIKAYNLTVTDLKDANGNVLPKENISAHAQKYVSVSTRFLGNVRGSSIKANVPDYLVPLNKVVEYGENVIAKGDNQGITVEIKTTRDTVPGTYTGIFELDIDGVKQNVDVSCEVWDIEYTGRREFQTLFGLGTNGILNNQYDNTSEQMERIEEFLLDYNVNVMYNDLDLTNASDCDEWLARAVKLFENDKFNTIAIPYWWSPKQTAGTVDNPAQWVKDLAEYIKGLAEISTEDKMYIEYGALYMLNIDEASQRDTIAYVDRLLGIDGDMQIARQYALKLCEEEGVFDNKTEAETAKIKEEISNFANIYVDTLQLGVTKEEIAEDYAVLCPEYEVFGDERGELYKEASKGRFKDKFWTYNCCFPVYPFPSFHITDPSASMRIASWQMKSFGVNGFLYYAVTKGFGMDKYTYTDLLTETKRASNLPEGDGHLLYPGTYYGSDTMLPSLRLIAWRDGQDDYDMLCVYQRLLDKYAQSNGLGKLDVNDYVADIYGDVFNGTDYTLTDSNLYNAREELASRILSLKNDNTLVQPNNK